MTLSDSERLMRIETLLSERCAHCAKTSDDHEERITVLEKFEERRKGGAIMIGAITAAAAATGGIVVKFWPFGAH